LIDASAPNQLRVASEADLGRDEDSVSSLAIGHSRDAPTPSTLVYAGINSSAAQRLQVGRNEHLRVFTVGRETRHPPSSTTRDADGSEAGSIDQISRIALFKTDSDDSDAYQRLLRLPEPGAGPGSIGVVASALGKKPQLAIFDIGPAGPAGLRGIVELDQEAEDVDVVRTGLDSFQVAYCVGHELYTIAVTKDSQALEPRLTYTIPYGDDGDSNRPVLRSVRYLTPTFILAVANLPRNAGVVLQVYRLPNAAGGFGSRRPGSRTHSRTHSCDRSETPVSLEGARVSIATRLPGPGKAARVAVCNLTPRPQELLHPDVPRVGDTQFLIAVAVQDSSISLFTLEHRTAHAIELLTDFFPLCTIKKGSGAQITGIALSAPPAIAQPSKEMKTTPSSTSTSTSPAAPVVKLATTSLDRMVSVHNIPLKRFHDKRSSTTIATFNSLPPLPRYVVATKNGNPMLSGLLWTTALIVLLLALIGQAFLEMHGLSRPIIHARKISPQSWHRGPPVSPAANDFWSSLLSDVRGSSPGTPDRRVVLHSELVSSVDVPAHDVPIIQADAVHPDGIAPDGARHDGREWSDLSPVQKRAWKDRLIAAGHWVEEQGEALFEEVLFDELAEVVGNMMM